MFSLAVKKMKNALVFLLVLMSLLSCKEKELRTLKKENLDSRIEKKDMEKIDKEHNEIITPKGTQVFHRSKKLYGLKWGNGFILNSVEVSECDNSTDVKEGYEGDKELQGVILNEDTFKVSFKAIENCCSEFLCEAEIIGDILNIIYHPYGSQCSCECMFDISYVFSFNEGFNEIEVDRTTINSIMFNGSLDSKVEFNFEN